MSRFRPIHAVALAGAVLVLAGCPGGAVSGALNDIVSRATAPYALLDLASGTVEYRLEVADAATNATYRDGKMVFRRVGTGTNECFVGIFEVTQAQWIRLDPDAPWLTVDAAVVPGAPADNRPAYAIDFLSLSSAVASYNPSGSGRLAIPTLAQWHLAAGTTSGWTWGAGTTRAQLDAAAWVYETTNGTGGPRAVGTLAASSLGFYDLHGNVWEWTQDTTVHGGSWRDGWRSSRVDVEVDAAAHQGVDANLEHALIGARLVLLP